MMSHPYGSPYSLDQAWPFIKDNRVALGFPDIIFELEDAYVRLLKRQESSGADVVLGLLPADQPQKSDMVETDSKGDVTKIIIKPKSSTLRNCWVNAVWTPRFSCFLHDHLASVIGKARKSGAMEKLADDSGLCEELAANGSKFVAQKYDRSKLAHEYLELLSNIASKR